MKTNKLILILSILITLTSCVNQKKTVLLANGKYVTQKKYDKMINNAFKYAEKETRKKFKMTKKEQKDFEKSFLSDTSIQK